MWDRTETAGWVVAVGFPFVVTLGVVVTGVSIAWAFGGFAVAICLAGLVRRVVSRTLNAVLRAYLWVKVCVAFTLVTGLLVAAALGAYDWAVLFGAPLLACNTLFLVACDVQVASTRITILDVTDD